jgi:hypothetical protein
VPWEMSCESHPILLSNLSDIPSMEHRSYIGLTMRRVPALILICVLTVQSAFAGLNRNKAKYVGGTTTALPAQSVGVLTVTDEDHLTFDYQQGKAPDKTSFPSGSFSLPYSEITAIGYGQHASLRIGQTIALAAVAGVGGLLLLLSKSKSHYLTFEYQDIQGNKQAAVFEVGKDTIRPLLSSLETRTGKTVAYEADPTNKQTRKP